MANGLYYHGYTNDLKRRIQQHEHGETITTSKYLPIKLVCYLAFTSENKAKEFEEYLKGGSGYAFRNRHLL